MNIDYDLEAALNHNGLSEYLPRITQVLAVLDGENDGADWHWIVLLRDPLEVAYITGGCDYTGWDRQSDCSVNTFDNIADALSAVEISEYHTGIYEASDPVLSLYEQIANNKPLPTWRQRMETEHPEFNAPIVDLFEKK